MRVASPLPADNLTEILLKDTVADRNLTEFIIPYPILFVNL